MTQGNDSNEEEHEERSLLSLSFVPISLMLGGIFFLGSFIGRYGAYGLFACLAGAIFFEAFSPSQFEKMRQAYPEMARGFWILNCLVFHLLLPVLFAVVLLMGLRLLV